MLNIISHKTGDFFLLDDGIDEMKRDATYGLIQNSFPETTMIDLRNAAKLLSQSCTTLIGDEENILIALGQGGTLIGEYLLEYLPIKCIYKIQCHRQWTEQGTYSFQHNFGSFSLLGKKVIILEDVIASGETIALATSAVTKAGGSVVAILSATISGESPFQNKHDGYNIFAAVSLETNTHFNKKNINAHWFPAVYSFRHLLYGEDENPRFYEILSKLYFGSHNIGKELKQIRDAV